MIDIIGTAVTTFIYLSLLGLLVYFSNASGKSKIRVLVAGVLWGSFIVGMTASGMFQPEVLGEVPGPVLAFLILLAGLFGCWYFIEGFRKAYLNIPLTVLIGINVTRLAGIFFLLLQTEGRLSAPFAPSAGWGDIFVGLLAVPAAISASRRTDQAGLIRPWNFLGASDLVVAILLGGLSAVGTPIRVFNEGPGTLALTTLPWIMIPTMLVPIFLLNHLAIANKLRGTRNAKTNLTPLAF